MWGTGLPWTEAPSQRLLCPVEPSSRKQEFVDGRSHRAGVGGLGSGDSLREGLLSPCICSSGSQAVVLRGVGEVGWGCFPCRRALPGSGPGFTRQPFSPTCTLGLTQVLRKPWGGGGSQHLGSGPGTLVSGTLGVKWGTFGLSKQWLREPEYTVMPRWAPRMWGEAMAPARPAEVCVGCLSHWPHCG